MALPITILPVCLCKTPPKRPENSSLRFTVKKSKWRSLGNSRLCICSAIDPEDRTVEGRWLSGRDEVIAMHVQACTLTLLMAAGISRNEESRQSAQAQWSPVQRGFLLAEPLSVQVQAILGKATLQILREI